MDLGELLKDALEETGAELKVSAGKAKQIIASEGARLAAASQEPGFDMVLRASRDNVALQLGIEASLTASAADNRIIGIIQTGLLMVATA